MPWAYSLDLRERILAALQKPDATYESVAEQFSVGRATVNRLLRRFRETGSPAPSKVRGKPPRALDDTDRAVLVELVGERPDATIPELVDDLAAATGKRVSDATLGRELRRAGITRKKRPSSRASAKKSASASSERRSSSG